MLRIQLPQSITTDADHFSKYIISVVRLRMATEIFPEEKDKLAAMVYGRIDIFKRLVKDINDLQQIVALFPDNKSQWAELIFNNEEILQSLCLSLRDVGKMIKLFPRFKNRLAYAICDNAILFQQLIGSWEAVRYIMELFPKHKNRLAGLIFGNLDLVKRVNQLSFGYCLNEIIYLFHKQKNRLAHIIFSDLNILKELLSLDWIVRTLVKYFPDYKERMADAIFDDLAILKKLIVNRQDEGSNSMIKYLAKKFPKKRQQLAEIIIGFDDFNILPKQFRETYQIKELVRIFPEHTDLLANKILENPSHLRELIKKECHAQKYYWDRLISLMKIFPEQVDKFITVICHHSILFNSIIKDSSDMESVIELFPEHASLIRDSLSIYGQTLAQGLVQAIQEDRSDLISRIETEFQKSIAAKIINQPQLQKCHDLARAEFNSSSQKTELKQALKTLCDLLEKHDSRMPSLINLSIKTIHRHGLFHQRVRLPEELKKRIVEDQKPCIRPLKKRKLGYNI